METLESPQNRESESILVGLEASRSFKCGDAPTLALIDKESYYRTFPALDDKEINLLQEMLKLAERAEFSRER